MNIRRIGPGDGPLLRDVRLQALLTDPDAFGSSHEEEASHDDAWWEERAKAAASGDEQFIALAEGGGHVGGMVGAYMPDASSVRHLVSTWVAPEARGKGLASELVDVVIEWARTTGAKEVTLWVVDGNRPAIALYEGAGFVPTGERQPLPSNPSLIESLMSLRLG